MRIYFDMCSLQRPLDDKTQFRVLVEAEAILGAMAIGEAGGFEMIASDALVFEADATPDPVRRNFAAQAIAKAQRFVVADAQVKTRARAFVDAGVKPLDALYLASAIAAEADYFCTCDDRLLRKARTVDTAPVKVVSPLELVAEIQP